MKATPRFVDDSQIEDLQRIYGCAPDMRCYPEADNKPMSYVEVARALNISRSRAQQIEAVALKKLKLVIQANGWESAMKELLK